MIPNQQKTLDPYADEYFPLQKFPPPHFPTSPLPIVWAPVLTQTRSPKLFPIVWARGFPRRRAIPPRLQPTSWRGRSNAAQVPVQPPYPFGTNKTLMIRNIPNRLRQSELVRLLADHCYEVNKSAASKSKSKSEFDLVYLPVDFTKRGNKGYAFVNFTSVAGAASLYRAWNNLGWEKTDFQTKKTRVITTAAIQGRENLKSHLRRSVFKCETDEYLAVELRPACDGSNFSDVAVVTVGIRVKAIESGRRN